MKVFVTGATGFIGRSLVPELLHHGHEVTCLVRPTSRQDTVKNFSDLGCAIALGDVTKPETFTEKVHGHDAVVHMAALVRLGDLPLDEMRRINVQATENVLKAASENDVERVLHTSSIAALGKTMGKVADETWQHPGFFTSPYERTKYEAQQVALEYARRGLHVTCALPSVVFGPRDPNFGWVFKMWAKRRIKFIPAPGTLFSFVHVEDLARGMRLALERGSRGETFIFTQANATLRRFFELCSEATGIPLPKWQPSAATVKTLLTLSWPLLAMTRFRRMVSRDSIQLLGKGMAYSSAKAQRVLGWNPGDFEARVRETAAHYAAKHGAKR